MFNAVVVGADRVQTELLTSALRIKTAETGIVAHWGAVYQTKVKARVSGRPGLRVITGDYRRRIRMELKQAPIGTTAVIYTDHPAGPRHEFGWNSVDSIGRHIPTPPRPHFGPDLPQIVDSLAKALESAAVSEVIRQGVA